MNESQPDDKELEIVIRSVDRRRRTEFIPPSASRWIGKVVARRGIAASQATNELESAWRELVGEAMAQRTRIGGVRRGVCEVIVENSSLLQQLSFQQTALAKQLLTAKPHFGIRSLRLRVGKIH